MKRLALRFIALACLFFISLFPAQAQVSFFQPPTYSGSGLALFEADFNGDGKPDLLTADGTLNLGNGDGTFTLGTPVSGTPLAVADFNGDGKADILEDGNGTLIVLLGNGDGTFQSPVTTASGANLLAVGAIDLNGDGQADVVGIFNNSLYVYLATGGGSFVPGGVAYSLGNVIGTPPVLSFGDFNADGKIDVAISIGPNNSDSSEQELVLLGNGNGTLQSPKASAGVFSPSGAFYPSYGAVGDFNGDGNLDLALSCSQYCYPLQEVYVFLGNGDGTFQSPTAAFSGDGPLVAADVNGDGKLDLVFQDLIGQIYLGNGDGTFSNVSNYVLTFPASVYGIIGSGSSVGVVVADFNSDGKLDAAMGSAVLLGNGNGTFQGLTLTPAPSGPQIAAIGDFDKNGTNDVAEVSGTSVNILSNNGSGSLSLIHTYTLQEPGLQIVEGDFNGDGNLDLAVVGIDLNSLDWGYSILLGNGDGSFQSPLFYPQTLSSSQNGIPSLSVADFNHDNKLDLAVASLGPQQEFAVLLGNGDGTFAPPAYYFTGQLWYFPLLIADFNQDGNLDVACNNGILYGKGDGTFQAEVFPPSLSSFSALFTVDVNNDGKPDLLSNDQIALGNGDGTFTVLPTLLNTIYDVTDINGDGKVDVLVGFPAANPTSTGFQLGNGDGTFSPTVNSVPAVGMIGPARTPALFADMNGDGEPDIIVLPFITGSDTLGDGEFSGISVLFNTTPPGFALSASALSPVTAGNLVTSTIKVSPTFGFNQSVALTCAPGLPAGVTCAFNPASIANSSGTSTLTITTTAGTAAGTYSLQAVGTANSTLTITNGAPLSLVVQSAPDFTVSPASGSSSQTVNAGQSASFSLSLAPSGSFTGTVNLSCAITPVATPAPICKLSSSSVQISGGGPQSVTVTVATTASSAASSFGFGNDRTPTTLMWALLIGSTGAFLLTIRRRRLALIALMLLASGWSIGCGGSSHTSTGGSSTPGTPAGTYTAAVTATSGSISHTTPLTVIVQ
jgi:hypothetical protein